MISFFTKQEKSIILFLLAGIMVGAGVKIFKLGFSDSSVPDNGEYTKIEQQFQARARQIDSLKSLTAYNTPDVDGGLLTSAKASKRDVPILEKVDINNAELEALILLPQIGPVLAKRIIDYRNKNGKFQTVDDIKKVKGIGEKKYNKIKPYIQVINND
ncbi:MAG: ComEA family DNA-binding protein [bacterium]|nr:ComEA family DNA-binding protein [bacterium]